MSRRREHAFVPSDRCDTLREMPLRNFLRALRSAIFQSLRNDVLDLAKAAAYSGMLMLFPAFLLVTTLLALVPAGNALLDELRNAMGQFLPADTMSPSCSLISRIRGPSRCRCFYPQQP